MRKQKSLKLSPISGFFILTLGFALPVKSYGLEGHFKSSFFLQDLENNPENNSEFIFSDIRLKHQWHPSNWTFSLDYQLQASHGETLKLPIQQNIHFSQLDRQQIFRLTDPISVKTGNKSGNFLFQRIDRLNANYSAGDYSITYGRQALSWGNGITFNPLDRFNPFEPNQFDREYKPGLDMVSAQKILSSGNELSGFILPRRNYESEKLTAKDSSFGLKLYQYGEKFDRQWILAKDAQEWLLGAQFSGDWHEGLWNFDLMLSRDKEFHKNFANVLLNYQKAFSWQNRNVLGFVELYYNGYGISKPRPESSELPDDLLSKQAASKTFMSNRWYLASGLNVEATPLLQIQLSLILNLKDRGILLNFNSIYSLSNQDSLRFGLQTSMAQAGTEFAGFANIKNQKLSAYPDQVYIQWSHYF